MGCPLWREDGSVFYNVQYTIYFTVSDLRLTQPGGPGPCIYIPQEQGGPVIPSGTGLIGPLTILNWTVLFFRTTLYGPIRKRIFQQFLYCCLRIRCRGSLFIGSLPRNGRLFWLHYSGLQTLCHSVYSEDQIPTSNIIKAAWGRSSRRMV
jgi:hypothetical protein